MANSSVLFRIESDPIGRVWSGVGDLDIPADAVEPDSARYLGGGSLISIPQLDLLINGQASSVTVGVSGISGAAFAAFQQEKSSLIGARGDIGKVYFDDDWQITSVEWVGTFYCDSPSADSQPGDKGRTLGISLSLGTEFKDRNSSPMAYWTAADQRRRSPDDLFCDHVAGITQGTSRVFSPSDAK